MKPTKKAIAEMKELWLKYNCAKKKQANAVLNLVKCERLERENFWKNKYEACHLARQNRKHYNEQEGNLSLAMDAYAEAVSETLVCYQAAFEFGKMHGIKIWADRISWSAK